MPNFIPDFSVAIPASSFLLQRMAGLTGVARSLIIADLVGARSVHIVGGGPVPSDWEQSFAVRERALPQVSRVERIEDIALAAGERLIVLPADMLVTRAGLQLLRDDPRAEPRADGVHFMAQARPAAVTWQILQASMKPGEGWFGRNINRPISFRASALLMRANVSPNAVTWFTFVLAMAMAFVLAHGGAMWLAVGGALYQAVSVIDCIDGDIARVTYRTSRAGAALDTAFDQLANLGFVFGIMVGVVRTYGMSQLGYAFGLVAVAALCMLLMTLLVRLGPKRGSFDVLRAALELRLEPKPRLQKLVLLGEKIFKRDFYALFAASLCVFGVPWLVPQLGVLGVCIWLAAIIWCAPVIAADKQGELLPSHLKAT